MLGWGDTVIALALVAAVLVPAGCADELESADADAGAGAGGDAGSAGGAAGAAAGTAGTAGTSGTAGNGTGGGAGAPGLPAPLAYYPFDGPGDVLTNAVGTYSGALIGSDVVTGRVGDARSFDGVEDYAEIPALPPLPELTVSIWIRVGSLPSKDVAVFDRWEWSTNQRSFYLGITNAALEPRMMVQGSITGLGAGNPMLVDLPAPSNAWTHYAATWDQTMLVLYRDGAKIADLPAVGALYDASSYSTLIARSRHVPAAFFKVTVDELVVWQNALSAPQIGLVYEHGAAGKPAPGG